MNYIIAHYHPDGSILAVSRLLEISEFVILLCWLFPSWKLRFLTVSFGSTHCVRFCGVVIVVLRWMCAGGTGVRICDVMPMSETVVPVGVALNDGFRLLLVWLSLVWW